MDYKVKIKERLGKLLFLEMNKDGFKENVGIPSYVAFKNKDLYLPISSEYISSNINDEIKIKNLKLFDIGKFEWHVTAYTHGTDGVTERKSRTARGNFEIKFELPKKVKITESGEQYGE